MGAPAERSPQDRAATRALAAAVIASVEADEKMAHGMDVYDADDLTGRMAAVRVCRHDDVEILVMQLAQEIAELVKERDDARKWGDTLVGDMAELESGRMWHEAATERERIRELLIRACDALETEGLEETAAEIRQQGGAFK